MYIIDHYPLGNKRTEISGGLNISEKLCCPTNSNMKCHNYNPSILTRPILDGPSQVSLDSNERWITGLIRLDVIVCQVSVTLS